MPRESERAIFLRVLERELQARLRIKQLQLLFGEHDDDYTRSLIKLYVMVQDSRYLNSRCCLFPRQARFGYFLHNLHPSKFKKHFRVCKETFKSIVNEIQDSIHFQSESNKSKKASVECHLLVLLKCLGCMGSETGREELGFFFGIGCCDMQK